MVMNNIENGSVNTNLPKENRLFIFIKKHPLIAGFCGLQIIFLFIVFSGPSTNSNLSNVTPVAVAVPSMEEDTTKMVFDVPELVGKSVKQVESILGPADRSFEPTNIQLEMGVIEADKTFDKNGSSLLITYDYRTGKIKDFFIDTPDPSGATDSTVSLLKLGNLERGSGRYTIKFVPTIKDPSVYTGVIVTPI